jgi:ABC-type uncharacterized transport system involved in gliding motility auxiliary subunit
MLQNEAVRIFLFFLNGILYLVMSGLWLVMPEEKMINFSVTIAALGLTSILFYDSRGEIQKINKSRKLRRTIYASLNFVLVLVIIAFLNYLSVQNQVQFDVSGGKVNSLTEQSMQVVRGLTQELGIKVFARKEEAASITSIMDLYQYQKNNIKTEIIDPDQRPDKIKEYNIDKVPTVVMEYDNKREYINENSELAYTNAMIKLGREKRPLILYLDGLEGPNLANSSKEGASILFEAITRSLFDLKIVNVLELEKIPEETKVVMLWGPKKNIPEKTKSLILAFVAKGGNLIVALDPAISNDTIEETRNFIQQQWGVLYRNNLVVDQMSFVSGSNGTVPLIKKFNSKHDLTKNFIDPVFFPLAQAVFGQETQKIPGAQWHDLTFTSDGNASWADMTPTELISGQLIFNSEEDVAGPVSIVGALEIAPIDGQGTVKKMLFFGNSSLILNSYAALGGNFRFLLKSLSWIAEDDLIQNFNLPVSLAGNVVLSQTQYKTIFYTSVAVVPLLFLIVGFILARKRRKT